MEVGIIGLDEASRECAHYRGFGLSKDRPSPLVGTMSH